MYIADAADALNNLLITELKLDNGLLCEYLIYLGLDKPDQLVNEVQAFPKSVQACLNTFLTALKMPASTIITGRVKTSDSVQILIPASLGNTIAYSALSDKLVGTELKFVFTGFHDHKLRLTPLSPDLTVRSMIPAFLIHLKQTDSNQPTFKGLVQQTWLSKAAKQTAERVKTSNYNHTIDDEGGHSSVISVLRRRMTEYKSQTHLKPEAQESELPIHKFKDDILRSLEDNPIIIVIGDTGSGKSTQLTQFLYDYGFNKIIACTQPRQIAAKSVSDRVSHEMDTRLGDLVGYSVRFDDKCSKSTRIKYMTDGILLRETLSDPDLSEYSVIMLDEAHERTLATDVLFVLLKQLSARRPDLKIIVTSATLDSQKFSTYFNNAPILNIPGRTFPVEIKFSSTPVLDYVEAALKTVLKIHEQDPLKHKGGDILVFLTGQAEIEHAVQYIDQLNIPDMLAIPLYSSLPADLQKLVFLPTENTRKVIFATNIAETSLTISSIRYVVDPGFTKTQVFDSKQGTNVLTVVPVSKAEANQRSGRAGRTAPGVCYRLYTEQTYETEMLDSVEPEIYRQNLCHTILLLKSLGVDNIIQFDFMDKPKERDVYNALLDLFHLNALDTTGKLTEEGHEIARMPLDPELAKVVLVSAELGCMNDIIAIISMLGFPHIWGFASKRSIDSSLSKKDQQQALAALQKRIKQAHSKLRRSNSDHLTLLNVYTQWSQANYSQEWCSSNYIQYPVMKKVRDLHRQLELITKKYYSKSATINPTVKETEGNIMRALCAGFFKNTAKNVNNNYETFVNGLQGYVHPSSVLFKQTGAKAQLILFNTLLQTSKRYFHTVSVIKSEYLLQMAPNFFRQLTPEESSKKRSLESLDTLLPNKQKQSAFPTTVAFNSNPKTI